MIARDDGGDTGGSAMYQRILVAVDDSDGARRALREALALAKDQQARLRLVHVMEIPYPYDGASVDFEALADARRGPGQALLDEAVALVRREGLEPEVALIGSDGGPVGDAIVAEARRWPADLIVLGAHDRGLLDRLLGSVAEGVIGESPVPVLLLRAS